MNADTGPNTGGRRAWSIACPTRRGGSAAKAARPLPPQFSPPLPPWRTPTPRTGGKQPETRQPTVHGYNARHVVCIAAPLGSGRTCSQGEPECVAASGRASRVTLRCCQAGREVRRE
jgi:hypothetical protein